MDLLKEVGLDRHRWNAFRRGLLERPMLRGTNERQKTRIAFKLLILVAAAGLEPATYGL